MSLLLDGDYEILENSGLQFVEDEKNRLFIIINYPLQEGLYISEGNPINHIEVLVKIPDNYNTSGTDMLWTYPSISRVDKGPMPNVSGYGDRNNICFNNKEYCRWSRHYEGGSWKSKIDNMDKILGRIEWALKNPSTKL